MFEVFKKLCEAHGTTTTAVLVELGISKSTGTGWKNGAYSPKVDKLQQIADYFNVPLEYLMTGVMPAVHFEDEETAAIAQAILESKELRGLFLAAKDAPPEDIEFVYKALLHLKKKEMGED